MHASVRDRVTHPLHYRSTRRPIFTPETYSTTTLITSVRHKPCHLTTLELGLDQVRERERDAEREREREIGREREWSVCMCCVVFHMQELMHVHLCKQENA